MVLTNKNAIPYINEWLLFQNENVESPNIRERILQSWREAKTVGLNGFTEPKFIILDEMQLQPILDRSIHLIETVTRVYQQFLSRIEHASDSMIFLFNEQGVLLKSFGEVILNSVVSNHLKPGLLGGFPFQGHTALSLAMKTKKPQYMLGAEHFYSYFHQLYTVAVPVFHPINKESIGCLLMVKMENNMHTSLQEMAVSLVMSIEEAMRLEYTEANIFKIHEEISNLIDHYIIILGSDGRVVDCNRALNELLPDYHFIGKTAKEFIEETFDYEYRDSVLYRAIYYGEEASNYEVWTKIRGKKYCLLVDTKIIHDPYDPSFYWIIEIFKDITLKKEMDQKWLQREKMASLGTLAAGLAHEIRNPLTTAKGFIQFLSEKSEDKMNFLLVQNELERISQLVNQFVLLSKPDSPQFKVYNVKDIIDEFTHFIHPEALLKGVSIQVTHADEDASIRVDKNQLTQVFLNLSQNAFHAMENGGILIIESEAISKDKIEIRFIDNGEGISEENLLKILDPFFSTKEEGTGLGLSICYQIIQAHLGEMKITSEEKKGTTVSIRLSIHHNP